RSTLFPYTTLFRSLEVRHTYRQWAGYRSRVSRYRERPRIRWTLTLISWLVRIDRNLHATPRTILNLVSSVIHSTVLTDNLRLWRYRRVDNLLLTLSVPTRLRINTRSQEWRQISRTC